MGLDRMMMAAISWGDRVVPKGTSVVVRTLPDLSDQGVAVVEALMRLDHPPRLTWLLDDPSGPLASEFGCRVVRARSLAGVFAYWRAKVVVHTHGVFGSRPASARKIFVNVWHGMPVKRLDPGAEVALHQTDFTLATAPVHAEHLATTWDLPLDRVLLTGLPRNDLLLGSTSNGATPLPPSLAARVAGRPLVVWLPTYRTAVRGHLRAEGVELGNVTQFEGADLAAVERMAGRLGIHVLIKVHPLAELPRVVESDHLTVWSTDDLHDHGVTLYPLLSVADVLITDHSSVWIDFLLTGRPMVFAISDLEEYRASRGHYFEDLSSLLPGPIAADLTELEALLAASIGGEDAWREARRRSLDMHHIYQDAASADRVATIVEEMANGRSELTSRRIAHPSPR